MRWTCLKLTAPVLSVTAMLLSQASADDAAAKSEATAAKEESKFAVTPELTKVPNEEIEAAYEGKTPPEAIRMYLAISKGAMMGGNDGWFGPAASRYSWAWLAEKHGVTPKGEIEAAKFQGDAAWFKRLDRNKDGKIVAEDLDWSDRNFWVQNASLVNRLFRKADPNGDGALTRDEWIAFYDATAQGQKAVSSEDLREAWLTGMGGNFLPGDAPTKEILLSGLFSGEVGSLQEGPALNAPAPDFTLKTQDGERTIKLSEVIGKKPVVLMFGNFTCGPFRSISPGVETVHERFKDDAVFIGVYVREAHPTDGWKMESNTKVGVAVAQPKTYDERKAVAQQCNQLLKLKMPLLVDDINDSTGNAYSGMPARLYVIDTNGRVAYKGGRGPFGFKPGEMEQALVTTLLEAATPKAPSQTSTK
jgi:alkyl hydroperoxide reductase subunit AhpC